MSNLAQSVMLEGLPQKELLVATLSYSRQDLLDQPRKPDVTTQTHMCKHFIRQFESAVWFAAVIAAA